ncbi:hypothetical protein STCU_05661 [Strigomonas culicis]|uniref:Uncharacterized protein n=1 Tax=Strigomonas culicis TaxID=28005 RepID=S9UA49_9TRYP|nr:hypothetical protein STCU_05661 [Strigomonas culicis]|eukprot:EPY27617.1 hypothetical protein STCU_05661 [Strigomonas culicis]
MPAELTTPGASSLQVLKQLLHVHQSTEVRLQRDQAVPGRGAQGGSRSGAAAAALQLPTMDTALLLRVVPRLGLEGLLLFDADVVGAEGSAATARAVPDEVLLAATTCLCGALTLTGGVHSVAALLDRVG